MNIPNTLIKRCSEVLLWQSSGLLPGSALRELAALTPGHDDLQRAEEQTKREAMRLLVDLNELTTVRCQYRGKPGAPVLSSEQAHVLAAGPNVLALDIDLQSKYCAVSHTFNIGDELLGIAIEARPASLYLNERVPRDAFTEVVFPDHRPKDGWHIHSSNLSRYTLSVTLIRSAR